MTNKKWSAKLGGQDRVFYFGLGFLGIFLDLTSIRAEEITEKMRENPFKVMPQLIYSSLIYQYKKEGVEPDFNVFDVGEWIDDVGGYSGPFMTEFMERFTEATKDPADKVKKIRGQRNTPAKKKR